MCACGVNTSPVNALKGEEVNALRKAQNPKFLHIKKNTVKTWNYCQGCRKEKVGEGMQ